MIPTLLILSGMLMMVWPCGAALSAEAVELAGNALRDAFARGTDKPIPDDMERAVNSLRLVRNSE